MKWVLRTKLGSSGEQYLTAGEFLLLCIYFDFEKKLSQLTASSKVVLLPPASLRPQEPVKCFLELFF